MTSTAPLTDITGACPSVESAVFATSGGTATMAVSMIGADGRTMYEGSVSVTTTPMQFPQLLGANWNNGMAGAIVTSVLTAVVYTNNSGSGPPSTTSSTVGIAPGSGVSESIAIGNYQAGNAPVFGRVAV